MEDRVVVFFFSSMVIDCMWSVLCVCVSWGLAGLWMMEG